jgi:NTE family protein
MEYASGPSAVVALTTGSAGSRTSEPGVAPPPTPRDDPALARAAAPVQEQPTPRDETDALDSPKPGIALCLSGGGYRAMLFHLGTLWRLNDAGYLQRLDRVSSVSGGSITAGVLGWRWQALAFADGIATNFDAEITQRLRRVAGRSIDWQAILLGLLLPGSIAARTAAAYRRHLFGEATLQDLPDDPPRFVLNATSLQSGVLWRFSKPYLWDYRVGEVERPRTQLATAVAASAAFPPFLSPVSLRLEESDFVPGSGGDLELRAYRTRAVLSDGGVYDNLGLETAWKSYRTVFVSDGGGHMAAAERPAAFWPLQFVRVLSVIDNQVRSLRKRQVIDGYKAKLRTGAYWGIRTDIADYGLPDALPAPYDSTIKLAAVPTRLKGMDATLQERLINWGYAVCDAALRRHVDTTLPAPGGFPYPQAGVGAGSETARGA